MLEVRLLVLADRLYLGVRQRERSIIPRALKEQ